MQEKRYYYDDLQSVAWMIRKFEMSFVGESGQPIALEMRSDNVPYIAETFLPHSPAYFKKCYIHPESLALLEPQVGDILFCTKYNFFDEGQNSIIITGIRPIDSNGDYGPFYDYGNDDWLVPDDIKYFKIIQRGGIAFLWPKLKNKKGA